MATRTQDHFAGVVALEQIPALGHHQPAEAEAEVERLVDVGLLLEQDVLAHDAEVGGAVGHVGGDVGGLEQEQAQPVDGIDEDQPARFRIDALTPSSRSRVERPVEQAPLGQGEGQALLHDRRAILAPRLASLTSSRS